MISISAVSYHGVGVAPLAARFDQAGGSIGRADGNRLILPDPDRTVSRLHAEIVHRGNGAFAVVNRGSHPITLNGQPLGSGAQAPIAADDELHIGAYVLRVGADSAASPPAANAANGIPSDWDPFATEAPAAPAAPAEPRPRPAPVAGPVWRPFGAASGEGSLDALFGLQDAGAADPLAAWGQSAPPSTSESKSVPAAPAATTMPAAPSPSSASPPPSAARFTDRSAPPGSVLSWNLPSGDSSSTIGLRASAASAAAPVAPESIDLLIPGEATTTVVTAEREPAPPEPAATTSAETVSPSDLAELTRAWREGLAAEGLPPEALQLTPALLRLLGRLLREATRGTIDLLAARAALKREIRAEVTMIVARENNPLKFSASADVALAHLLGAPERGFMPGDHAMRDAYEDLRAHQFATMAGMRAALEGIFTRFDPALLEAKLTQKSLLASLVPSSRKARMWDLFNEMYTQIAAEASDDFHELFGKAFLSAYEEHIRQLEKDRP